MKEARDEVEALKLDLKKAQKEIAHNLSLVKRSHTIVKGFEVEKFDLLRCNAALANEIIGLKAELQNGEFLENTFRCHPHFDGFAKDFSYMGFKFLLIGVKDVAPKLDLGPLK